MKNIIFIMVVIIVFTSCADKNKERFAEKRNTFLLIHNNRKSQIDTLSLNEKIFALDSVNIPPETYRELCSMNNGDIVDLQSEHAFEVVEIPIISIIWFGLSWLLTIAYTIVYYKKLKKNNLM